MARVELVRVECSQARVYNFPADPASKASKFKIKPGGNNLAKKLVEVLEAGKAGSHRRGVLSQWRKLRDSGVLSVHGPKESAVLVKQPEGPGAPPNLADRNVASAMALVRVTSAVDVLELWHRAEKRNAVKRTIEERLADLGAVTEG